MNVGTSLHAITDFGHDVKPFYEALADIAAGGYSSVMLLDRPGRPTLEPGIRPDCCLLDFGHSDPAEVARALAAAGLTAAALHCGVVAVADEQQAAGSLAALRAGVALATRLGIDLVIPNGGVAPAPLLPSAAKQDLIERLARLLTATLDGAPRALRLAIDLHYHAVLETVADCRALFALAPDPRVGLTLNIGHLTTNRQPGWELVQEFPERIHVLAWKDHVLERPTGEHPVWSVELGQGDSPFERYVEVLRAAAITPLHLITFENVPFEQKKDALYRSLAHLRRLWA